MTRILCIDDNLATRYVYSRVLRNAGYEVVEGGTAAEALRLVREAAPDLLLLDVNLPDGNGGEVCLQIRNDAELAHTPVVLTSASSIQTGDRIRGLNCGADAYLTEPTDSEELAAIVNSMLRMSRAERAVAAVAETSSLLADTLVLSRTLERIAGIAVKHLADWAVIDLARDGQLVRECVTHRDPAKVELAQALVGEFKHEDRSTAPVDAFRTKRPQLVRDAAGVIDGAEPRLGATLLELGVRSFICIPLIARGECVGVLSLVSATRNYDETAVSTATILAERAALAIDNAILFQAAEEANRAKDDFLALVSHELRTPLTAISGWIELLHRDPENDILVQGLGELSKSAAALRRLVEDLLDLSRMNSGKMRVDSKPVDLSSIASDARDVARAAAAAKSIHLSLRAEEPVFVLGDSMRMQQIASNLINNAVKFTQAGGTVEIAVQATEETVSLRVADTGRGIASEFLPHVFDRFSQADPDASTGLGLGLALVKQLTELHGGKVRVDSEGAGRGATFTVTLPRIAAPVGV